MTFTDHDFEHWLLSKRGTHGPAGKQVRGTEKTQPRASKREKPASLETEAGIQKAICDYLHWRGIPFSVTDASRTFNANGRQVRRVATGWPDLVACYQARLVAIECKSAKGKLRPAQAETLAALWEAGAIVVVVRSVEDLIAALRDGKHEASKAEIQRAKNKQINTVRK